MGKNNQVLEASPEEAFRFVDITRVDKFGKNQEWKRIVVNDLDKWRNKMIKLESLHCYATIQRFTNGQHTEGEPYICPLYFDLDSDDGLQRSLDDARKLKDYIFTDIDLDAGVEFFFSGNRGFHVTVDSRLCGFRPSPDLAKVVRYMADYVAEKLPLATYDRAVYSKRRMWRMVNTMHGKTALWKIQLTPIEIGTLSIDDIRDLAQEARDVEVDV